MDKQTCKTLAEEAEKALQSLAEAHGMTVTRQGGQFSATEATIRFQFAETTGDGIAKTPEYLALAEMAPDLAGQTVPHPVGGGQITLIGWNHKAPKFPLEYEQDGKRYKASAAFLRAIQARRQSTDA